MHVFSSSKFSIFLKNIPSNFGNAFTPIIYFRANSKEKINTHCCKIDQSHIIFPSLSKCGENSKHNTYIKSKSITDLSQGYNVSACECETKTFVAHAYVCSNSGQHATALPHRYWSNPTPHRMLRLWLLIRFVITPSL